MAGTITASMAGDLMRRIIPPSKPNNDIDEKFNKLKGILQQVLGLVDPASDEYIRNRDEEIKKFKVDIGLDDFPIKEQKKIIEKINEHAGSNYDTLETLKANLNNTSSILYKNISSNVKTVMSAPLKAVSFSKSVIEQLSDSIKTKVQNISPIKALSTAFSNIRSMLSSFATKLSTFNPVAKIIEYVKKLFDPIVNAIKFVGEMIMTVIRFIVQVVMIAFQLLVAFISFLFTLTLSVITFLFTLTTTIISLLFTLATTVITLLFTLTTAIITGLLSIMGIVIGFIVSIAITTISLMATLFVVAMTTMATIFLAVIALFSVMIFAVLQLLIISSLMALLVVSTMFAVVFIMIPLLIAISAISIATFVMTGVLLFTMLFFIAPMIFGIMAYLIGVITPMLALITTLCLISSIAGIIIIAIVLIIGLMLYKLFTWAKAFYVDHIKPWVDKIIDLWNTYLQPVIDWIKDTLMVVISWVWDIFKAGWDFISGIINSIWEFISNPAKMISQAASKVGNIVSEKFSVVTEKLASWGKSVVDTINPMNWFAEGKIALEPMRAVFAEAGPEAAIPLNEQGLMFLKKTFNIDDKSFNSMINNSDLFKAIIDIKDQNVEIIDTLNDVKYKMDSMETPSYHESITQSYTNMYSGGNVSNKPNKKDSTSDLIMMKLADIVKKIEEIPKSSNVYGQPQDDQMNIAKMIATGLLGRR
jgi:hypothetical protein